MSKSRYKRRLPSCNVKGHKVVLDSVYTLDTKPHFSMYAQKGRKTITSLTIILHNMYYFYQIISLLTPMVQHNNSVIVSMPRVSVNRIFNWADSYTYPATYSTPWLRINQNSPGKQFPPTNNILTCGPIVLHNKDASPHYPHWIFPNQPMRPNLAREHAKCT